MGESHALQGDEETLNPSSSAKNDRYRGCLLGLAAGDALGTTVEFKPRGTFPRVTDILGGGPFGLRPGEWTDDTSMALCLATSLLHRGGFDPGDQMNRYSKWLEHGYLSSNGRCFDIGVTVRSALMRYKSSGDPMSGSLDPRSAGNGSLMRLAPIPMFFAADPVQAVDFAGESSRTTHGCAECVDACRYFAKLLVRALTGCSKEELFLGDDFEDASTPRVRDIAAGSFQAKGVGEIRGSGYVIESLEAALWSFCVTDSFESAVIEAVNLGEDADTTGAICGQLAGAFYGVSGIPQRWVERLALSNDIRANADQLFDASGRPPPPVTPPT